MSKIVEDTKQFSKDLKRAKKRGKDIKKLKKIVGLLSNDQPLDDKFSDHALIGNWKGSRDCHLEPDWILIYTSSNTVLRLERTGSHSDLFKK